jgi:NAD(P)-dependent dehydrogenase (short-subunit alcohol dehydrogenase family)
MISLQRGFCYSNENLSHTDSLGIIPLVPPASTAYNGRMGSTPKTTCACKTVLITGGTDGLGKAAALLLARRHYVVFAAGRSADRRAALERQAHEQRLTLHTLEMDVCDQTSVQTAVQQVFEKGGGIDVLINNAGVGYMAAVEELQLCDFRRQFETNFFGLLQVTKAVLPHMRTRRSGRILMISSAAGLVSPPTYGAYSASKHAVEGLSNALRLEMYPFGVEVILIEPGYIATNFQPTAKELAERYVEKAPHSPYAKVYAGTWAGSDRSRRKAKTTPEDCAGVMLEAIEAHAPKARYPVTALAKQLSFARRILPDTLLDSLMRKRFGITRD